MKKALLPLILFVSTLVFAGPGDTVLVTSLDNAQLTWWGSDDDWGIFPDTSYEYRKILMDVTLGCATGGCSDWDYTVKIEGFHETGIIDSALTALPSFTVDGQAVADTYYFSNTTTFITSWDAINGVVDSVAGSIRTVYIYGDTTNYLVPTDTLYVWDANFTNDVYDGSGNVINTVNVPYDSFLVTTYIYRNIPFEVINKYELGRFMTPYGGYMATNQHGFDNNFKHTYTYDVTDYAEMFHDSVKIRAFYGGWSSGFSVDVNFRLIEGTPIRRVLKMENIYQSGPGGWRSDNGADFENNFATPKTVSIESNTAAAMARIIPSGHGFVNSQNCAEFCNRDYYLKTNNVIRYTQSMWRDDCGLTPIYPQGGTWLYDRANWCPGNKTHSYDHDMTPYITAGTDLNIDLDVEIIDLTVPSGETPPNYIIEGQFFQYDVVLNTNDVEISDIISPSTTDAHSRKNPICGKPKIKIRNNGSANLTSLTITYGVVGATQNTFNWTGSLSFLESEEVELDVLSDWNGTGNIFEVSLNNPNGTTDDYPLDNSLQSTFEPVVKYVNDLVVDVSTNSRAFENEWYIYDAEGNEEYYNGLPYNYDYYSDTIPLEEGCYEFVLHDSGKNGLYWWANNDGYGEAKFMSAVFEDSVYHAFESDFGTEIRYQFIIEGEPDRISKNSLAKLTVSPNPSNGLIVINSSLLLDNHVFIKAYNMLGEIVYDESNFYKEAQKTIDLSMLKNGVYLFEVSSSEATSTQKITILH